MAKAELYEHKPYITLRLHFPSEFKPDTFRAIDGPQIPYNSVPKKLRLPINVDSLWQTVRIIKDPDVGYLIQLPEHIQAIMAYRKGHDPSEGRYPQALRFYKPKWTLESAIEWVKSVFNIKKIKLPRKDR